MAEAEIAGRYTRRGTLGTGAGTVVYEAFDRLIERRVAVKVVTLPPIDDPETADAIARFRRGAKAAGGLSHPNIVAVFDYGEDAERAWIVMELVEGGSLKAVLDSGERLPIPVIVRLMGQVLDGLGYSHARGVVHRDIKPANIMLTPAGTAKITDFGIARLENSSMTHVGTMMSPRPPRRCGSSPGCLSRSPSARPGRRWAPRGGWLCRCWSTSTAVAGPAGSTPHTAPSSAPADPAQVRRSSRATASPRPGVRGGAVSPERPSSDTKSCSGERKTRQPSHGGIWLVAPTPPCDGSEAGGSVVPEQQGGAPSRPRRRRQPIS